MTPHWKAFAEESGLIGTNTEIPESKDLSGLGADITWFSSEESQDEIKNYWPGIGVASDGYIPVGGCDIGSGDPYFIRSSDGDAGPLYRIYHDAVGEDGYSEDEAIAVVLSHYTDLTSTPIK